MAKAKHSGYVGCHEHGCGWHWSQQYRLLHCSFDFVENQFHMGFCWVKPGRMEWGIWSLQRLMSCRHQ